MNIGDTVKFCKPEKSHKGVYNVPLETPVHFQLKNTTILKGFEQNPFNERRHNIQCILDVLDSAISSSANVDGEDVEQGQHVDFCNAIQTFDESVINHVTKLSAYYSKDDFKSPLKSSYHDTKVCTFEITKDFFDDESSCIVKYVHFDDDGLLCIESGSIQSMSDSFTNFQTADISAIVDCIIVSQSSKTFFYNLKPIKITLRKSNEPASTQDI